MINNIQSISQKFDTIITKLSSAVFKTTGFHVRKNGRFVAPANTSYKAVYVDVPNTITFERFTGRYSKNAKNLQSAVTWEALVSNAVMDVDTLPRSDSLHNTSFLGTYYGCMSAPTITQIRCKMEVTELMQGGTEGTTHTWDMNLKQSRYSEALANGKYAYMAMFDLRLYDVYPNGIPDEITALRLDKIYTEACTSGATAIQEGSVTTVTVISNE